MPRIDPSATAGASRFGNASRHELADRPQATQRDDTPHTAFSDIDATPLPDDSKRAWQAVREGAIGAVNQHSADTEAVSQLTPPARCAVSKQAGHAAVRSGAGRAGTMRRKPRDPQTVVARAAAARERVAARVADAVLDAPELPRDLMRRLRELIVLSQKSIT
jgi:hypothetical protein